MIHSILYYRLSTSRSTCDLPVQRSNDSDKHAASIFEAK